jgi:hypothetical protein
LLNSLSSSRAEAVRLSGQGGDPASGFDTRPHGNVRIRSAPQDRDETICCGPERFRLSILIDRSRVRVPPGASALR